jgi:hypothetical protein
MEHFVGLDVSLEETREGLSSRNGLPSCPTSLSIHLHALEVSYHLLQSSPTQGLCKMTPITPAFLRIIAVDSACLPKERSQSPSLRKVLA